MSVISSAAKKEEDAVIIVESLAPLTPVELPFPVILFLPPGIRTYLRPSEILNPEKGFPESESTKVFELAVKATFFYSYRLMFRI